MQSISDQRGYMLVGIVLHEELVGGVSEVLVMLPVGRDSVMGIT